MCICYNRAVVITLAWHQCATAPLPLLLAVKCYFVFKMIHFSHTLGSSLQIESLPHLLLYRPPSLSSAGAVRIQETPGREIFFSTAFQ